MPRASLRFGVPDLSALGPVVSSFLLVAAGELGDKTQLLAFSLAVRFRKPWPVFAGVFVGTVLNHGLATSLGALVAAHVDPRVLGTVAGVAFLAFGAWTLKPDGDDDDDHADKPPRFGPFLTTAALFFLAEMGDKTQLAAAALAARFHSVLLVMAGTVTAMLVVDGIAVFVGDRLAHKVQGKWVRYVSAALFFAFGGFTLWAAWSS